MRVSLVIPAYNEAARLPGFLASLVDALATMRDPAVEILVVDDGSAEPHQLAGREAVDAAREALAAAGSPHRVEFIASPFNAGKGAAIRRGWGAADAAADWLGFVDADGAISPAEVRRLVRMLADDPPLDVLAGSRIRMAGKKVERSVFRHLQGRIFATLGERALELGFYDTQCGVKFARASMLRPVLGALAENGWMLDVELLAHLKRRGARMVEAPIDWVDAGHSKVRFGVDAVRMLAALVRIRRRAARL